MHWTDLGRKNVSIEVVSAVITSIWVFAYNCKWSQYDNVYKFRHHVGRRGKGKKGEEGRG